MHKNKETFMIQQTPGQFCWNELITTDINKAKEFYSKTFGWTFEESISEDSINTLAFLNDKLIAGIYQNPSSSNKDTPSYWLSYIYVSDAYAALEKAKRNGAKQINEVVQVGNVGRLAIIADPTGAVFGIWEVLNG
jgi:predicted enzyme related to lactoylglutathione lyase